MHVHCCAGLQDNQDDNAWTGGSRVDVKGRVRGKSVQIRQVGHCAINQALCVKEWEEQRQALAKHRQ